jgi:hypothetical protein
VPLSTGARPILSEPTNTLSRKEESKQINQEVMKTMKKDKGLVMDRAEGWFTRVPSLFIHCLLKKFVVFLHVHSVAYIAAVQRNFLQNGNS